jgi:hypothetical protein
MVLSQPAGRERGNTKQITRSRLPSVALTTARFGILAIQLAVLLPAFPHFLAVLIHLQPVFQLLGAALPPGVTCPSSSCWCSDSSSLSRASSRGRGGS